MVFRSLVMAISCLHFPLVLCFLLSFLYFTSITLSLAYESERLKNEDALYSCHRPNTNTFLHLMSLEEEMHLQASSVVSEYEYREIQKRGSKTLKNTKAPPKESDFDNFDLSSKKEMLRDFNNKIKDPLYSLFHDVKETTIDDADCNNIMKEDFGS